MPGVHGAEGVLPNEGERLFLDLILWRAENSDQPVPSSSRLASP